MISKSNQLLCRSVLCAFVLAGPGCSQSEGESATALTSDTDDSRKPERAEVLPAGQPRADSAALQVIEALEGQIATAKAELSGRVGADPDKIGVAEARSVQWSSGALGCPEKGMEYTQAIVPGVLLILKADGKSYRYHGDTGRRLFYCPDSRAQAPAYGPGEAVM